LSATATLWPAAVSERSAGLLAQPCRPARVLGAFPAALYLGLDDHHEVLPLVTPRGLRLPTAVTIATEVVGWGVQAGDEVMVGAHEIRLPAVVVRAVRTWRPAQVPTAARGCRPVASAVIARLPWREPARKLTERVRSGDPLSSAVAALVGAGPGLTPSGDDVLCGVLLGLRVHGSPSAAMVPKLWSAVRSRLASTTSLSAALLIEAAQGYAVPPVVRLAEALVAGDEASVAAAAQVVLTVGHTSGADLLGGLLGALDALAHPTPLAATSGSLL
jgi:hypothetical protein